MSDLHVLPLRGHDLPPVRLYVRARVFRLHEGAWTWQHRCNHDVTKVALVTFPTQRLALLRARSHMRWCV